ncbi:hypothetical protein WJX72_003542 [[Myrmecia] bisecta]|uniref:Ammonium transporter AmtB-like domain-containing protein n=1 Tax=[Myrmecia] bisecta TaxID=41462 RepID=A0AAW1PPL5_9CHLO
MSLNFTSPEFTDAVTAIVEEKTYNWIGDINASFVLTSGYLVFMMQLGFALLTIGCVQAKSARSVCLKNIMDAAFGAIGYYLFGWAFAYGDKMACDADGVCVNDGNPFIGTEWFALNDTLSTQYYTWFFQYVFAISTATIVSGAVAERVKFIAYALYAFFLCAWVYPVLSHWVWSGSGWASPTRAASVGGLLIGSGAYDTVGSGAVHMVGGFAALAGAWVAGPRLGRFDANGKPNEMPGHNAVYYTAGVLLLWFGFYGFNPGTMGQIVAADGSSFSNVVARCALSTTLGGGFGAASGLIVYLIYSKLRFKHFIWDLTAAGNGALGGMIVITSGCATLRPWSAALGGIIGGALLLPGQILTLNVMKVDDPVDAFTLHGICGAAGVLFYALFADQAAVDQLYGPAPDGSPRHYGWFMGDTPHVLGANVIWILVIAGWTLAMMVPFFKLLDVLGLLRVSPQDQMLGVDVSHHGGSAYPSVDSKGLDDNFKVIQNDSASTLYGGKEDITSLAAKIGALEAQLTTVTHKLRSLEGGANGVDHV